MKKKIAILLLCTMALSLTACGGKKDKDTNTEATETATKTESYGEVELCDYMNIEVEKSVVPVTDDDVESRIDEIIEEKTDYERIDEAAAEGNFVQMYFTGTADGEVLYDYADQTAGLVIGDEDLGEEFDKILIGKKADDKFNITVSYEDDFWNEDVAGLTIDYDVTIAEVDKVIPPEINQDFYDSLGYADEADMKAQVKEDLQAENDADTSDELNQNIISKIVEESNFISYTDEIYAKCEQELKDEYDSLAAAFEYESGEVLMEAFGMTDEDVEQEVLSKVYEIIAMNKIIDELGLTLSDDEYQAAVAEMAAEEDYESVDEYVADYGEESIKFSLLEAKACDIIKQSCKIVEVEDTESEDIEGGEEVEYDEEEGDIMLDDEELGEGDIQTEVE